MTFKLMHGLNDPQNLSILSNSETFWERFPEAYRKFPFLLNIAKFALLMSEALLLLAQSHRSDLEFRLLSLMSCGSQGIMYVKGFENELLSESAVTQWFCAGSIPVVTFENFSFSGEYLAFSTGEQRRDLLYSQDLGIL